MLTPKPDRPYLERWLRRTRRQLAPSGRLSETALILSRLHGHAPEFWSRWIRSVLDGDLIPTLDELTAVDAILAEPCEKPEPSQSGELFRDS